MVHLTTLNIKKAMCKLTKETDTTTNKQKLLNNSAYTVILSWGIIVNSKISFEDKSKRWFPGPVKNSCCQGDISKGDVDE